MKTINKYFGFYFIALLAFTGCKDNPRATSFTHEKAKVIIIKPMAHPSLDACINGFREGLAEGGYGQGNVDVEILDANGNFADIPSLAKTAIAKKPNLIFTVTTSAAAAAIKITDTHVPLVYSAVTDPVQAGIVTAMDHSGTMATGTSDRYNVKAQVDVFTSIAQSATAYAIVRSPNEPNSKILGDETINELKTKGLKATEYIVSNAADISVVVKQALAANDCIVVNGDNMLIENLPVIINLCTGSKKPLFVGDPDSVKKGAVATVGPSYSAIGEVAGRKAAEILSGKNAGSIPSENPNEFDYTINTAAAQAMGINIPPQFWNKRTIWESRAASIKRQ